MLTTEERPFLKRCFVSSRPSEMSENLVRLLAEHGVETFRGEDISAGGEITSEILNQIRSADFVCAFIDDDRSFNTANIFFELGTAHALQKPVVLITTKPNHLFSSLRGIYVIKATNDNLEDVSAEVSRFLRNAKPLTAELYQAGEPSQKPSLSSATHELELLRRERPSDRELRFQRLVGELFRKAGAEVVEEGTLASDDRHRHRADLIIWLDGVSSIIGGPIIVECKYYGGRIGNILLNSRYAIKQLETYIGTSNARMGLLVYSHERWTPPPSSLLETPRVLAFSIDELIQTLESGTFITEVFRRRQRAGYARVPAGGSH